MNLDLWMVTITWEESAMIMDTVRLMHSPADYAEQRRQQNSKYL